MSGPSRALPTAVGLQPAAPRRSRSPARQGKSRRRADPPQRDDPAAAQRGDLALHAGRLQVPRYDRRSLARGVVHLSVGSFHRAHQALYFDALARRGLGDGWALTGVGLYRRTMKEVLAAQDGLYTVLSRGRGGDEARVVGIITRYLFAPEQQRELLSLLASEETRLVTLTVTPNGYDTRAGQLTAPSLLAEALHRRRQSGRAPFTVLSCDNMPDNGAVARAAVLAAAHERDPATAAWIHERGAFPSSMVDRITPGTCPAHRRVLEEQFGVQDRWPVVTEPISQWVIEDAFCAGRPPLETVGVQFTDDVRPFATMKTRLLNGSHCALGYLGVLAGHERVDETVSDPMFAAYLRRLMDDEIVPLLPRPRTEALQHATNVRMRLANPVIADPLSRLCRNGSMKVLRHLLSSIMKRGSGGSLTRSSPSPWPVGAGISQAGEARPP